MTAYTILIGIRGSINSMTINVKVHGYHDASELARRILTTLDGSLHRLETMKPEDGPLRFEIVGIMPSALTKPYDPFKLQ